MIAEGREPSLAGLLMMSSLPIGSIAVPFCGSYLGSYKVMVIPKRNDYGVYGYIGP